MIPASVRGDAASFPALLFASTILGAGVLMAPPSAQANETRNITSPQTTGINVRVDGANTITITSMGNGVISDTSSPDSFGINAASENGDTTITVGASVSAGTGVAARSAGDGRITITTTADVTGTDVSGEGVVTAADYADTRINLGANVTGQTFGVLSESIFSGAVAITTARGVMVTGGSDAGIIVSAYGVDISLGGAVSGAQGVLAGSFSSPLNITTAAGATITGRNDVGLLTHSDDGPTTIRLGGNVTGATRGIDASASGSGSIMITTDLGVAVTGTSADAIHVESNTGGITINVMGNLTSPQNGISTQTNGDKATSITIGSASTVTGSVNAILANALNGDVIVANAGALKGSITGVKSIGGTASFTLNNSGVVTLASTQKVTGFQLINQAGGLLTGTGNFGDVTGQLDSILRPGSPTVMGTLSASSLKLAAGAIVEVRADNTGASDKIVVSGAAALNGATLKIAAAPQTGPAWATSRSYTILTAASVTGQFKTTQLDYAFLKATLAYSDTAVTLSLARNWTSFGGYATTPNQKAVAGALEGFLTQDSNPLIAKVAMLTVQQAPAALSQLSGAGVGAARTQALAAGGLFSDAITTELSPFTGSASGGASLLSYAPDTRIKTKAIDQAAPKAVEPILDSRIWAHVLGGFANLKADGVSPAERATNYGLAAGVDTALSPKLRGGFAVSGGQSQAKVAAFATKADATWGQGALYGVATDGDSYAKAVLVYGYLTNRTERNVSVFAAPETAKGTFGANLFSARFEAGQNIAADGPTHLTPFAAFEPAWLVQDAYAETGAPTVALGYSKTTTHALPATLGVKLDSDIAFESVRVTPSATIGWVHDFADTSSLSPFFTALPGSTFTVAGAKGDRNLARTDLNIEASPYGSTATFYANARADLGQRTTSARGTGGVMMRF